MSGMLARHADPAAVALAALAAGAGGTTATDEAALMLCPLAAVCLLPAAWA
jgi:hypothetical protein